MSKSSSIDITVDATNHRQMMKVVAVLCSTSIIMLRVVFLITEVVWLADEVMRDAVALPPSSSSQAAVKKILLK